MALAPLSHEDMRLLRRLVEKLAPDDDFLAVAVLTGEGDQMALSVLGHELLTEDEIEDRYRAAFGLG